MSDSLAYFRDVTSQSRTFVNSIEGLQLLSDRLAADPALAVEAANAAKANGRDDLSATDFTNFQAAVTALLQTYSGNVKAFLYEML